MRLGEIKGLTNLFEKFIMFVIFFLSFFLFFFFFFFFFSKKKNEDYLHSTSSIFLNTSNLPCNKITNEENSLSCAIKTCPGSRN